MKQLTFKEYLETKDRLREAVDNVPQQSRTYVVRKYCKLPIGESKEVREYVSLKPKQRITVEWLYDDVENPTPVHLLFEGVSDVDPENEKATFWEGSKLIAWLGRNAREETA